MANSIHIIGAGGFSKVVQKLALGQGYDKILLYDQYKQVPSSERVTFCGVPDADLKGNGIVAIGRTDYRRIHVDLSPKLTWQTLIHPTAIIAEGVSIGEGSIILPGVIIQDGVTIGSHCVINCGTCIDHDVTIGDFVHIGMNCSVGGEVNIPEGQFIRLGSIVA